MFLVPGLVISLQLKQKRMKRNKTRQTEEEAGQGSRGGKLVTNAVKKLTFHEPIARQTHDKRPAFCVFAP